MKIGDTYIIVDKPVSQTVDGYEGCAVKILTRAYQRRGSGVAEVEVQILGLGPVGRRRVLTRDLVPGGQLGLF